MLAYNKIMYHFHVHNEYDHLWEQGNEITVDKRFNKNKRLFLNQFSTGVYCINPYGFRPLCDLIDLVLPHINSIEKLDELKDLDRDIYLNNMKNIYCLLKDSSEIIKLASIYNIETALEEIRQKYYNVLPSRLNSLFVFDDEQLETWYNSYRNIETDLYEVALTGNLFETSAAFTPPFGITHEEALARAHSYWNPNIKKDEEIMYKEYLFNGKAKVLRKINKEIE